jgi:hypothetical protein
MLSDAKAFLIRFSQLHKEYASRLLKALSVLGKASTSALGCCLSKLLNQARASLSALTPASCLILIEATTLMTLGADTKRNAYLEMKELLINPGKMT